MSTENIRNPANWLLSLWDRLPRDEKLLNKSSIVGWAYTLGAKEGDIIVLDLINSVFFNSKQAVSLGERLPVGDAKKARLLSWKDAFTGASHALALNHPWSQTVRHFTAERRVHLQYCALELDSALEDLGSTSKKDLSSIRARIDELIDELGDAHVDNEFRALILDLLETLRRACAEYHVRGNKGVFDALTHIFSNLFRYKSTFDSEAKRRWSANLREVLSVLADIATVTGYSALSATPTIAGLLP